MFLIKDIYKKIIVKNITETTYIALKPLLKNF